jgi:hypothetical protein
MQQKDAPTESYGEDEEVMIEPLPGHGDDEIRALFEQAGATPPTRLAPGFWSGKVPVRLREGIRQIASVHRKPIKQLH